MSERNATQPADKQDDDFNTPELKKLVAAALLGTGLVIIQAFIPLGMIDMPVSISMLAFAVSIPLLGADLLAVTVSRKYSTSKITHILFWFGVIGAGVGITAAFWHASWIAGVMFFLASVVVATTVIFSILLKTSHNM